MFIILWDVKEPAHLSQRVGHVVPGVVVCLHRGPCVRKLFTGLIMYYRLKIKNIVLYCIVLYRAAFCTAAFPFIEISLNIIIEVGTCTEIIPLAFPKSILINTKERECFTPVTRGIEKL